MPSISCSFLGAYVPRLLPDLLAVVLRNEMGFMLDGPLEGGSMESRGD